MSDLFYKGIVLSQRKDPALSRELREFLNADTMGLRLDLPEEENPLSLPPDRLIEIARLANIVDERDGVLLADKLQQGITRKVGVVVADAMDDEPFVSSQLNPTLKNTKLAQKGLELCQYTVGAAQAYFAVYKNLTDLEIRIPKKIGIYAVKPLHGRYPAEFRVDAKVSGGETVSSVLIGAGAILHFARAVYYHKPQTTAFITVAGDCVSNPMNLEVSIGMTATQVLERCGLLEPPHRVVIGGSMTGISVLDTDQTAITPTTRAVLAFREDLVHLGLSCIGCGRCVRVCPQGLNPYLIYRSIQQNHIPQYAPLDARRCLHCGTCSYICPAKLNLADEIFHSYAVLKPRVEAYETQKDRAEKYENTKYDRYLLDFQLGKAVLRHRAAKKELQATYARRQRDALAERSRRDRQIDDDMHKAQQTLEQSRLRADGMYMQAKAAQAALEREVQARIDGLTRARDEAYALSDKATAQVKAHQSLSASVSSEVREVLLAEVQRITGHEMEKKRRLVERLESKGDKIEKALLEEGKKARDKAEKDGAALEKRFGGVGETLEKSTAEDLSLLLEETRARCEKRMSEAEAALKAAEAEGQVRIQKGEEILAQAAQTCADEKAQAERIWDSAQREALERAEQSEKQLHLDKETIDSESLQAREDIDTALRRARTEALRTAWEHAAATARLMGRQPQSEDFLPPGNLLLCERELLSKEYSLPIDYAPAAETEDAEENVETLCMLWKTGQGDVTVQLTEEVPVSA